MYFMNSELRNWYKIVWKKKTKKKKEEEEMLEEKRLYANQENNVL